MPTIVIADDQAVVRFAVRAVLEADDWDVVGEGCDTPSAVQAVAEHQPDVVLLDVHMPGRGLEAARQIASVSSRTAVVIFTVAELESVLLDAARVGVSGILPKDMDLDRLGAALEGVLRGEAALPRTLVARLLDEFHDQGRTARRSVVGRPSVWLSSREAEVLEHLRRRRTTAQIGDALFVSPATVRSHVSSLLKKFDVPDRDALLEVVGPARCGTTSTPN